MCFLPAIPFQMTQISTIWVLIDHLSTSIATYTERNIEGGRVRSLISKKNFVSSQITLLWNSWIQDRMVTQAMTKHFIEWWQVAHLILERYSNIAGKKKSSNISFSNVVLDSGRQIFSATWGQLLFNKDSI